MSVYRSIGVMVVAGWLAAPGCWVHAVEGGSLAAHYSFDEGRGMSTKDISGSGNDGTIHGATWVKVPGGYALEFDGLDDFVDCGNPPRLDIRGPMTMMAWLCPAGLQPAKEPGILGKQFSSYLLTYYLNRLCFWYINSGGNATRATVMPGTWSHVAATFDRETLRLYVNGELASKSPSRFKKVEQGGKFVVGALAGDSTAVDPNYRASGAFKGMIDDVKVFNRAISAGEVRSEFASSTHDRNEMFRAKWAPLSAVQTIRDGEASVAAGRGGSIQINNRSGICIIESQYSYPGRKIGFNRLAEGAGAGEHGWRPSVSSEGDRTLRIEAAGEHYTLQRTVRFDEGRIEIEDTLVNSRPDPIGVMITHRIITPETLKNLRIGTTADNPTIFFSQSSGDFGFLAEDNISRLQFEASGIYNNVTVRHSAFALDAGKAHTFRYAVYPLEPTGDAFAFINRVRHDWKSDFTIEGPFDWFDVFSPLMKERDLVQKYITRRNLRIAGLSPWLDYEPGGYRDRVLTREEFKVAVRKAANMLREISPGIKVIGSVETDWATIYPDKIKDGQLIGNGTQEQLTKAIDAANLPWKDSVKRDKNGHLPIERYLRGGKQQFALGVYPAPGNHQEKFLLEQAKYIIEEVGLDGIYIDEFNQAWSQGIRSYGGWDGTSVDIDPNTGRILRKYVNCSLVGIPSRVKLINYVLGRGKVMFTNTYATSLEEQSLPIFRFWEMQGFLDLNFVEAGKEPPLVFGMCQGLLGSPLGLGVTSVPDKPRAAGLMLGMMSYLRHGLLYCHYWYPGLPEVGPGSGAYGPINHMYPFTPVELHKGWLKGRERIVGCVSFETDWDLPRKPKVLLFDSTGRPKEGEGKVKLAGDAGNWRVRVQLDDWREFVVLE